MSSLKKYADALERIAWTAIEGAGAVGLIAGYQALPVADIPAGWVPPLAVVLGVLIAAGKNVVATNIGNGSASTLPAALEPVPPRHALDANGDGVPDIAD